ncbi:TIGR03085 family metal-binding protein [Corynebacterium felinum]|uniref:Uncharacterized protein (TIGR03085 family) n=1 Tax=Corynebacterium felinum TaxID=131318 RepID=A0ABU2BBB5_9CORY|nr:TIGR03085 family metal-binding protein [Corynebacterium felinum]MDF5820059.1 TIGR03085 family metal-binding protein [Corynebacterium felinum]MDR7355915.1 uncharacterized protein (TIGR03085 family) [Corynebacterium felinum]WJY95256.1 hypothetical protein CFELI_08250 [Corynebacterium felinum]
MKLAQKERQRLVALMHAKGPHAPTLCEGWTVHDLLVHMVIRENQFTDALGMFIPRFARRLERASEDLKSKDFFELIDRFAAGPHKYSPFRYLDKYINVAEYFIHHEDVRRAHNGVAAQEHFTADTSGEGANNFHESAPVADTLPRKFTPEEEKELHTVLKVLAPLLVAKSEIPVILEPYGYPRMVAKDRRGVAPSGDHVITIRGSVGEILLFLYGRECALVETTGDRSKLRRSKI